MHIYIYSLNEQFSWQEALNGKVSWQEALDEKMSGERVWVKRCLEECTTSTCQLSSRSKTLQALPPVIFVREKVSWQHALDDRASKPKAFDDKVSMSRDLKISPLAQAAP